MKIAYQHYSDKEFLEFGDIPEESEMLITVYEGNTEEDCHDLFCLNHESLTTTIWDYWEIKE